MRRENESRSVPSVKGGTALQTKHDFKTHRLSHNVVTT